MLHCIRLGYTEHCSLLVAGTDCCSQVAAHIEDIHHHNNSVGIQIDRRPRIAGMVDRAGKIVLLVGRSLRQAGRPLLGHLVVDCSSSFVASAARGFPPARQDRPPKS